MSLRSWRRSVLVIEDDRQIRELFVTRLKASGFDVRAVGDGVDALRRIDAGAPSAIVLDLGLPLLNGRDVLHELASRADTRHIPVVVVTGDDPSGLDPSGFACVLRKPIEPDALVAAVIRSLDHRSRPEPI